MTKREEKKEDGRYIIYYKFNEENSSQNAENRDGKDTGRTEGQRIKEE